MGTWRRNAIAIVGGLGLPALTAGGAAAQVDPVRAEAMFAAADTLCRREGGRLWGTSLCGPMVIADAVTGTFATNQAAPEGPRPRALGYANAALDWGGTRWSTFVWQVVAGAGAARDRILMHELFHRIQPGLGLFIAASDGAPDHLDTPEGRYWMQLEWRALARALRASGRERRQAVREALAFRQARRALEPGAGDRERVIEINEGLAQYTGTVAAAGSAREALADVVDQLERAPETASFVRTAAYATGAAYGILLDAYAPGWTRRVAGADDLGALLMAAARVTPEADPEALAPRYGGPALLAAERAREAERVARVADLRRRFVEGPVLIVPRGRNASFVTSGVTPIPGAGTIYPRFRVTGDWGSIEAEQVLMAPDGETLTVPAPGPVTGPTLTGPGWTVTLAAGWVARPGSRPGDYRVVPERP